MEEWSKWAAETIEISPTLITIERSYAPLYSPSEIAKYKEIVGGRPEHPLSSTLQSQIRQSQQSVPQTRQFRVAYRDASHWRYSDDAALPAIGDFISDAAQNRNLYWAANDTHMQQSRPEDWEPPGGMLLYPEKQETSSRSFFLNHFSGEIGVFPIDDVLISEPIVDGAAWQIEIQHRVTAKRFFYKGYWLGKRGRVDEFRFLDPPGPYGNPTAVYTYHDWIDTHLGPACTRATIKSDTGWTVITSELVGCEPLEEDDFDAMLRVPEAGSSDSLRQKYTFTTAIEIDGGNKQVRTFSSDGLFHRTGSQTIGSNSPFSMKTIGSALAVLIVGFLIAWRSRTTLCRVAGDVLDRFRYRSWRN